MLPPQNPSSGSSVRVTRLAPSPTGALHLGNARTFLLTWAIARQRGWRIVFRIEDLDSPRVKPGASQQAIDDLRWIGLDWDADEFGSADRPLHQSDDLSVYRQTLGSLREQGLIYPCRCSRSQILSALSAPHAGEHETRYPGLCRPRTDADKQKAKNTSLDEPEVAWRLIVPDETIALNDRIAGPLRCRVQQQVGDFLVATKTGVAAYQLAVVIDDLRQGVTDVIRGDDLLFSAARQMLVYRLLNANDRTPTWWHLPLVLGSDGRRLAKRHGDSRLSAYRQAGIPAEKIIGLLACWSGIGDRPAECSAADFLARFEIEKLSPQPVIFDAPAEAWLSQSPRKSP